MTTGGGRSLTLRDYLDGTRDLAVSIFFVTPILLLYEVGIVAYGSRLRNGADVLLKTLFSVLGQWGFSAFNILLFAAFVVSAARVLKRGKPLFALYVPLLAESLLYAMLVAPVASSITSIFLMVGGASDGEPFAVRIFLSVGAGVYEEAFFRLGLLQLLNWAAGRAFKLKPAPAAILSIAIESFLFAGFHHIGPLGETFRANVFLFRFLSGILLSIIFMTRGFGVAVYTHALYDVAVFLRSLFSG